MNSLAKALNQLDIRLGSNPIIVSGSPSAQQSTSFEKNDLITMVGGKKVGSTGYFVRYSGEGRHRRAVIHRTSSLAYIEKGQVWKTDIWKKNEIPDVEGDITQRFAHNMLVIPSNDGTNDHRLVLLGGNLFSRFIAESTSVQSLQLRGGKSNPRWSPLPKMHESRCPGAACVEEKVYAIGGHGFNRPNELPEATYEVLDLNDMQRGWVRREIPVRGYFFRSCKAVAVANRHIYVVCAKRNNHTRVRRKIFPMSLISYDTQADTWNTKLAKPLTNQEENQQYGVASIVIPGEGTYVVVVTGRDTQKTAQAYHVESNKWIRLPSPPYEGNYTRPSFQHVVTTIGNRYVLFVGSESVAALDWKQRKWIALPSKPEFGNHAAGAFVGGSVNKLIITGGCNGRQDCVGPSSLSLDIAPGIGWAKEKLLLLCFKKKAQKGNNKVKVKGPCLLEDLDSGIFANILTYLFVPFQKEIECKGSIFAEMMGLPVRKRSCDPSTTSQATKKSRIAL